MAEESTKLNEEQVFLYLKSLNVPVRLSDLQIPSREFVIRVIECFLNDLQIDICNPILKPWAAIKHIENIEMCEDAQYLLLLASSVNFVLRNCGLNVSVKDINEPKPKRTKKIFNYLIYYWNFYLKKYSLFQAVQENHQHVKETADNLVKEIEILDEKIQSSVSNLNDLKLSKEELVKMIGKNKRKLDEYAHRKDTLSTEYQELKKKEMDLVCEVKNEDLNIASVKEAINEIDQCILSSPEKISSDIHKVKTQIKDIDVIIGEKQAELKSKKEGINLLANAQARNAKDLEFLSNIKKCVEEHRNCVEDIVEQEKKCDDEIENTKKLQIKLGEKGEQKDYYEKQATQSQIQALKKKESFVENLCTLDRQVEEEKECLTFFNNSEIQLKKQVDETINVIITTHDECKKLQSETLRKTSEFESKASSVIELFNQETDKVKAAVKTIFSKHM